MASPKKTDGLPRSRRGRCPHRPVAPASARNSQRQRKSAQRVSQPSPGRRFPQGPGVSVPDCRKGLPTIPRRRQEVCAGADRPAEALFLFHRARRILFLAQPKREWGAHPRGNGPLAGARPPRPPFGGQIRQERYPLRADEGIGPYVPAGEPGKSIQILR